jgi:acyl carrier protein
MIPSYFIFLDRIPLTPNGKVDVRTLRSYTSTLNNEGSNYIAPKHKQEIIIADAWKEVLKLDKVGIKDNFFEIGGNSLNIVQLKNKLKDALEIDIPLIEMFRFPTIESLFNYLYRNETGEILLNEENRKMNEENPLNELEGMMKESVRLFEEVQDD